MVIDNHPIRRRRYIILSRLGDKKIRESFESVGYYDHKYIPFVDCMGRTYELSTSKLGYASP